MSILTTKSGVFTLGLAISIRPLGVRLSKFERFEPVCESLTYTTEPGTYFSKLLFFLLRVLKTYPPFSSSVESFLSSPSSPLPLRRNP